MDFKENLKDNYLDLSFKNNNENCKDLAIFLIENKNIKNINLSCNYYFLLI
jgi:hypothetical protein